MLKLKLQYFGHLMQKAYSLENTLMLGKIEGGKKRGRQMMIWLDGITNSRSLPTLVSIVGDAVQPSHPLSSPSPPALNLSQHQGLFQRVSSLHQVARVLEFQLQRQSFQRTPGLVSFRTDWLDFLAVQGILKSLLQHHSSKASILWRSAFFIVRVSHPYVTTGKTIALTR